MSWKTSYTHFNFLWQHREVNGVLCSGDNFMAGLATFKVSIDGKAISRKEGAMAWGQIGNGTFQWHAYR